jgi:competence protein ComEC
LITVSLPVSCGPTTSITISTVNSTTISNKRQTTGTITSGSNILNVYFIDVGQGDSILIDHGETEVLIDGGPNSNDVTDFIRPYIDGAIEAIIATHVHYDHVGGLIEVLRTYEIEHVWLSDFTEENVSLVCANFMALAGKKDSQGFIGKRGDNIHAGDLLFTVLSPAANAAFSAANDNSLVLALSYGTVDFLFTGDAGQEVEKAMIHASDLPLSEVEILKVGWHGCGEASSMEFLNVIKPKTAVYMAGENNQFGYPYQETLERLSQIGAKVYGTDVNGTIMIRTDGITYEVITGKY